MTTFFGKRVGWIKLKTPREVELLDEIIAKYQYDSHVEKIAINSDGWYAIVPWPREHEGETLTGDAYRKWESIKSYFYRKRRDI